MQELKNKTAVITGASQGIGAATAEQLAGHGVRLILAARSTDKIENLAAKICANGGVAEALTCDVSRYSDVEALVSRCMEAYGQVDIIVNNAGVIEPIARLADSDPSEWDRVVDINFKGVYHGMRAVVPVMMVQGSGVIINLSSGAAGGALEGWSHYCSTKAAVLSLTRCGDKELRDHGIRVIGLSPGTVATDMQLAIKSSGINPVSQLDPSVHIPADWPARAIAWLCTKEAEEFSGTDFSLKDKDNCRRAGLIT